MAEKDGPRFLERTKAQFLEDLAGAFGERSEAFTSDLKVLLFELWVRARSRPPFPDAKPEPPEEMKQAEFEKRLSAALTNAENYDNLELAQDLVHLVQRTIVVGDGLTRDNSSSALEISLDPEAVQWERSKTKFAELLEQVLIPDGQHLEKRLDHASGHLYLDFNLPANAVGAAIPDIAEHGPDDDDQERLEKRLRKLGVLAPYDWIPVMQHKDSGQRAALDILGGASEKYLQHTVETLLVYDNALMVWRFPNPRPLYTYDDCLHVRLWVGAVEQANSLCTWNSTYDSGQMKTVVETVQIPGTDQDDTVKASYTTMTVEIGF